MARAQSSDAEDRAGDRADFQEFYQNQKRSQSSFFGSAPNHHVTPKRDNISFTVQADAVDVIVGPDADEKPSDFENLDNRLEMTGWSFFPLVAFSSERFGIGFTGEAGNRQIKYLDRRADSAEGEADGHFYEQYSDMSYSGAGVYGFLLLRANALPKWLAGTVIVGGRTLTATHQTPGVRTDSNEVPDSNKLKYDVTAFDVGLNVGATLAKRFTVFPWLNYRWTQLGDVKDRNGSSVQLSRTLEDQIELDRSLTWLSDSPFTYGLDFAVQIQSIELHLGGVFGYLASMNRGADRIQDGSIEVGVSYDFKSR